MKGKRTCNNSVFPLLQPHRDSGVRHLLSPSNAAAQLVGPRNGAAYLTTVRDSSGNFPTRKVLTLHADHTMSVVAADQGGPHFFSSQLGSWHQMERVEWSER